MNNEKSSHALTNSIGCRRAGGSDVESLQHGAVYFLNAVTRCHNRI
jgi:hypothetical protein